MRRALIDPVEYASCYVYAPAGAGGASERSRMLCAALKSGDEQCIRSCAVRIRQQTSEPVLTGFFDGCGIFVPVPRSARTVEGRLWAAERIAAALVAEGLGRVAWPGLRRSRAVRKSATAPPGKRPSFDAHYESFSVEVPAIHSETIILIDDVVTKGRTLLAAAARLREIFPRSDIRAFALLRTLGLTSNIPRLMDPCRGVIAWRHGDAQRRP